MKQHNIIRSDEAFWEGHERAWAWVQTFPRQQRGISTWVLYPAACLAFLLWLAELLTWAA